MEHIYNNVFLKNLSDFVTKYAYLGTCFDFVFGKQVNQSNYFNTKIDNDIVLRLNNYMVNNDDWIEMKKETFYQYKYEDQTISIYDDGYKTNEIDEQFYSCLINFPEDVKLKLKIYRVKPYLQNIIINSSKNKSESEQKNYHIPNTDKHQEILIITRIKYILRDMLYLIIDEINQVDPITYDKIGVPIYKISVRVCINSKVIDNVDTLNTCLNIPSAPQIMYYVIQTFNIIINNIVKPDKLTLDTKEKIEQLEKSEYNITMMNEIYYNQKFDNKYNICLNPNVEVDSKVFSEFNKISKNQVHKNNKPKEPYLKDETKRDKLKKINMKYGITTNHY